MQLVLYILASASLLQGLHSAQWSSTSPQDGVVMYVCKGADATLLWKFVLSSGDAIGEVQWFYNGNSQELVAVSSHDKFLPATAFANRVQAVDNAGITVSRLIVADSGNYSVEVRVDTYSGAHAVLRRSVFVQVIDGLMVQDEKLQVTQRSEPVLDTTTDQWAIQLQCGTFTFRGDPPYTVEWSTPSGNIVNSSDYNDNHFNLLLTSPIQGGNYTCRVSPQQPTDACFHGNGAGHVQASVNVDKMDARMTLLEKENQELKRQLRQSDSANSQAQSRLQQTEERLQEQLRESYSNLSEVQSHVLLDVSSLQRQVQNLTQVNVDGLQNRVEGLEDRTRQQIWFHASGLREAYVPGGLALVVNTLHYNHGNAYSNSSGRFTAPYPGVYFFTATSGPLNSGSGASIQLNVDHQQLSKGRGYNSYSSLSQGSVHAVVHLTSRQTVWLEGFGETFDADYTTFSGFLVSPDP